MVRMMGLRGIVGALVAGVVVCWATRAEALYTYTASSSTDTIYVGCRAGRTAICDDGALTEVETDCTLSDDIKVNGDGGTDTITIVRSAAVAPSCAGSSTSITSLTYNGRYIDLNGGTGNDTLSGGTGDHHVAGSDGDDIATAYSNVGFAAGDGGEDLVSVSISSAGWEVYGGSHDDCVKGPSDPDPGSLPDVFDCGSGSEANGDEYVNVSGFAESNCESAVAICQ